VLWEVLGRPSPAGRFVGRASSRSLERSLGSGAWPSGEPGASRLRDLIEAIQQVLTQIREQFEQRDAWVARVEVCPVRVVDGDAAEQHLPQLGKRAGVHEDADGLRCRAPADDANGGTGQVRRSGPRSGAGMHITTVAIETRVHPRNATFPKRQKTAGHREATL
jgi:hypothetical protein